MLREPRRLQTHLSSSASPSLPACCTLPWHVAREMSPVSCLLGTPAKHRAGAGCAWPPSYFARIACTLQLQAGDPVGSCTPAEPPLSLHTCCQCLAERGFLPLNPSLEGGTQHPAGRAQVPVPSQGCTHWCPAPPPQCLLLQFWAPHRMVQPGPQETAPSIHCARTAWGGGMLTNGGVPQGMGLNTSPAPAKGSKSGCPDLLTRQDFPQ